MATANIRDLEKNSVLIEAKKEHLDEMYICYNKREFVHPDPLEFLYHYNNLADIEVTGLIASSLAYGNVKQILKSVSSVLNPMGLSPYGFITSKKPYEIIETYKDFKHRFTTGTELSGLLIAIKNILNKYGSLKKCFIEGQTANDDTVQSSLHNFVKKLNDSSITLFPTLIPLPERKSACKRLHLFLRWMVRKDNVDPGGWEEIGARKLIVPLDVHMHRISYLLKLTGRKDAGITTAVEVTKAFSKISKDDPVKYDFALTRIGIKNIMNLDDFIKSYHSS